MTDSLLWSFPASVSNTKVQPRHLKLTAADSVVIILPDGMVSTLNLKQRRAYIGAGEVEIKHVGDICFFHYLDTVKCTYTSTVCDQPVIQNSEDVLSSKPRAYTRYQAH